MQFECNYRKLVPVQAIRWNRNVQTIIHKPNNIMSRRVCLWDGMELADLHLMRCDGDLSMRKEGILYTVHRKTQEGIYVNYYFLFHISSTSTRYINYKLHTYLMLVAGLPVDKTRFISEIIILFKIYVLFIGVESWKWSCTAMRQMWDIGRSLTMGHFHGNGANQSRSRSSREEDTKY